LNLNEKKKFHKEFHSFHPSKFPNFSFLELKIKIRIEIEGKNNSSSEETRKQKDKTSMMEATLARINKRCR
jgi:hypothetical protein